MPWVCREAIRATTPAADVTESIPARSGAMGVAPAASMAAESMHVA